jgi:hypothetical protein
MRLLPSGYISDCNQACRCGPRCRAENKGRFTPGSIGSSRKRMRSSWATTIWSRTLPFDTRLCRRFTRPCAQGCELPTKTSLSLQSAVHGRDSEDTQSQQRRCLLPSRKAGCSLAASITAADVRELKRRFPGVRSLLMSTLMQTSKLSLISAAHLQMPRRWSNR